MLAPLLFAQVLAAEPEFAEPPPAEPQVVVAPDTPDAPSRGGATSQPDSPAEAEKPSRIEAAQTPWLVARYDYSQGFHRYGAGYHFGELHSGDALVWWSVGPEFLFTTKRNTSFEAFEPAVRGRVGGMGHAGLGGSLEAGLTIAAGRETVTPSATAGLLANVAIVEAGVLGQWPFTERPEDMPVLWFAARFHLPTVWLD